MVVSLEDWWSNATPTVMKVSAAEWDFIQELLDEPDQPENARALLARQTKGRA